MELDPRWHERFMRAQRIGRAMPRTGQYPSGEPRTGFMIMFSENVRPRLLYSARGSRFTTREAAEQTPNAIHLRMADGATVPEAVSYFAPKNGKRLTLRDYIEECRQHLQTGERWNGLRRLLGASARTQAPRKRLDTSGRHTQFSSCSSDQGTSLASERS